MGHCIGWPDELVSARGTHCIRCPDELVTARGLGYIGYPQELVRHCGTLYWMARRIGLCL